LGANLMIHHATNPAQFFFVNGFSSDRKLFLGDDLSSVIWIEQGEADGVKIKNMK
jgi:hypothetical protein